MTKVIIAELAARFPACFAARDDEAHKPLKIGIFHDISARVPDLAPHAVRLALGAYVRRTAYQCALAAGRKPRIDLDGTPVGPVSDEHMQCARKWLCQWRAPRDSKQAAPPAEAEPSKASIADLRAAAAARRLPAAL